MMKEIIYQYNVAKNIESPKIKYCFTLTLKSRSHSQNVENIIEGTLT